MKGWAGINKREKPRYVDGDEASTWRLGGSEMPLQLTPRHTWNGMFGERPRLTATNEVDSRLCYDFREQLLAIHSYQTLNFIDGFAPSDMSTMGSHVDVSASRSSKSALEDM